MCPIAAPPTRCWQWPTMRGWSASTPPASRRSWTAGKCVCWPYSAPPAPGAEVPTVEERGLPGAVYNSTYGIGLPYGAGPHIVQRLHDAFHHALFQPRHVAELAQYDQEPTYLNTQQSPSLPGACLGQGTRIRRTPGPRNHAAGAAATIATRHDHCASPCRHRTRRAELPRRAQALCGPVGPCRRVAARAARRIRGLARP